MDLGGHTRHFPPMAQNFLNFMQFFVKFGKIICWRPAGGLAPPPTGNPGSPLTSVLCFGIHPAILVHFEKGTPCEPHFNYVQML